MKVLFILDEDDKYGAAKAGIEMILTLRKNHNVTPVVITSKKNNINSICNYYNIENYVTKHHKFVFSLTNSKMNNIIKYIPRYIRYVTGNIIAMRIIKNNINLNEIDIIHSNNSGLDLGIKLSKKYSKKNIIHIREYGPGNTLYEVRSYKKKYINEFNKNVDKFIAISKSVKKYWEEKGLNKKKIYLVYDGIEISKKEKKRSDFLNGKINFVMLGSISKGKGQLEFLKAITRLNNNELSRIKVDIIGSGEKSYEKELKKYIDDYNLNNTVRMCGYVEDISKKICGYDIGVICSDAEGFGRVTIEYMAAGLCILGSNKGANKELLSEGRGLLYEKNNIKDLHSKISFLIENPEFIKNKRRSNYIFCEKFNTINNAKNIYDIYKGLIK